MTADHPVRPWVVTDPCTCTKPGRAPDLSPAEAARVAEFDAAPVLPEVLRERVAVAIFKAECDGCPCGGWEAATLDRGVYRQMAAAAIAALSLFDEAPITDHGRISV